MDRVKSWYGAVITRWRTINPDLRIIITTAVVAVLAYLVIKSQTDPTEWAGFRMDVLVTLFSLIFGIPIALGLSRYQEDSTRKEQVYKMLILLRKELKYNKRNLVWNWAEDPMPWETASMAAKLKDDLWNAFSDGGEIEWIKDIDLLGSLAEGYYSIRVLRRMIENHAEFGRVTKSETRIRGTEETKKQIAEWFDYSSFSIGMTLVNISQYLGDEELERMQEPPIKPE